MISDAALREFKAIWNTQFGLEIADDAAMDEAISLLMMFDATYRPIKQEWVDEYENAYGTHWTTSRQASDACAETQKEN